MIEPAILSFGEVLWDLFPDGECFGGAPANFASHAAILGGSVRIVSAVGDEGHGRGAVEVLRSHGVDTQLVQTIPGVPTGTVGVQLDLAGEPRFTIHENAAWEHIAWTPQIERVIGDSDAVYFGTLGQRGVKSRETIRRAMAFAKAANTPRLLDVNLRAPWFDDATIRESVQLASILKLSDEELGPVSHACGVAAGGASEHVLREILQHARLDLVIMTCGAEGALLVSRDGVVRQPGIPVKVCDTVGAGDAFAAAFLMGILQELPHDEILRSACARASLVCSLPGAVPRGLLKTETANSR